MTRRCIAACWPTSLTSICSIRRSSRMRFPWPRDKLVIASIDHAMWFHRSVRVDDWLLYAIDSPSASGARGFTRGSIFARDGRLVASVCARRPDPSEVLRSTVVCSKPSSSSSSLRRVLIGGLLTLRSSRQHRHAERGCTEARRGARARAGGQGRGRALGARTEVPRRSAPERGASLPHLARQTNRWQSHQRFLARRCLRYTASQRMPIFSSTRIEAPLLTSTVEITRSARKSKNAASTSASAISVAYPLPHCSAAEHITQVDDVALDQGQIAGADQPARGAVPPRRARSACAAARAARPAAPPDTRRCCLHRGVRKKDSG